jgi:membrane protein DedA with SNARE-associated domain
MVQFIATYGLAVMFAAIALESLGVPVPGESTLIAASALASRGHFHLGAVIVLAATAAIVGDNIAYVLGRWGGHRLIERYGWLRRLADRVLPRTARLFARHGGATVFFARFVTGVRMAAAWMAGVSRMEWRRFVVWNALGGIVWANVVALAGDVLGELVHAALSHLR